MWSSLNRRANERDFLFSSEQKGSSRSLSENALLAHTGYHCQHVVDLCLALVIMSYLSKWIAPSSVFPPSLLLLCQLDHLFGLHEHIALAAAILLNTLTKMHAELHLITFMTTNAVIRTIDVTPYGSTHQFY